MFTIETKINGVRIGEVYCRNLGKTKDNANWRSNDSSVYEYYYEYYQHERELITGKVLHIRDNGIEELISLIYSDIIEEIKRNRS